jgi:hypothetical protein
MKHLDDDVLTLLALEDEQPDKPTAEHLRTCERCREELRALSRTVTAGRSAPGSNQLVAPPARVWEGIQAELGALSRDDGVDAQPLPSALSPRRRRAPVVLAVAAAFVAGAVLAGTVVAAIVGERDTATRQVAAASLEPLGAGGTTGRAEVVTVRDQRYLDVAIDRRTSGEGYREVWLLDPEEGRLVSLGVLTGTKSRLAIPEGLELTQYAVVDVSREPFDGNPEHSTDSIARGPLTTVLG